MGQLIMNEKWQEFVVFRSRVRKYVKFINYLEIITLQFM